jgi:transcriptional regulator with XRE-family HTH domain
VLGHALAGLAARRQALGYTQETLAQKLGVEHSTVGRWERGVHGPLPWQGPDLAEALNVSVDELDVLLTRAVSDGAAVVQGVSATGEAGTVSEHEAGRAEAWPFTAEAIQRLDPRLSASSLTLLQLAWRDRKLLLSGSG